MKFNLKNRPKVRSEDLSKELLATIALGMEDWFAGFEKELRERLEKLQNVKGRRSAVCRAHEAGEIETIKEILGE